MRRGCAVRTWRGGPSRRRATKSLDPVRDYLGATAWDGRDHIGALAAHFTDAHEVITYADGTARTVMHAWLRRWLIGAVGKVYGKAQNPMLTLTGGQGIGKSHFVQWLCSGLPDLHVELAIRPDSTDQLKLLSTKWIWEVAELGATTRRADREALKSFITLGYATYRPPYGRYELHKPALASFIGTVNPDGAGFLNARPGIGAFSWSTCGTWNGPTPRCWTPTRYGRKPRRCGDRATMATVRGRARDSGGHRSRPRDRRPI